jgi:hypothetical protein
VDIISFISLAQKSNKVASKLHLPTYSMETEVVVIASLQFAVGKVPYYYSFSY